MKRLLTVFAALLLIMGWTSSIRAEEKSDQFIIINKSINKLAFYEKGELVKTFSVATGREQTYTPEGIFNIANKIKNRPYYTKKIPGGDPRNPLGDRWMGLDARGTYGTIYGIHGNSNEKSIGQYVSLGCVRMHNEEIRWLFDQVKVNTPVVITRSKDSFDAIAIAHKFDVVTEAAAPIEKYEATLTLLQDVPLYSKPSLAKTTNYALNPQKVSAFEKAGNWYHIKTWFGDAWIKPERVIAGEIQPVDLKLVVTENIRMHEHPIKDSKTISTLSPQAVEAFEKWENWYHIHGPNGVGWISGNFPEPPAIAFDTVLPEHMSDEMKTWFELQSNTVEADSRVWNDELYLFTPRGEVLKVWDLGEKVVVEGTMIDNISYPNFMVKLQGDFKNKTVQFHIKKGGG